jgi:hypothetical protein
VALSLQEKTASGWVTRAANVADTTSGDAATVVQAVRPLTRNGSVLTISENAASGALAVYDATTGQPFASSTLGPGKLAFVGFSARFDNGVLGLAPGAKLRVELAVSHGNAHAGLGTAPDVDIDGSGAVEADEARVASAWGRFADAAVPPVSGGSPAEIVDTLADISTTGTVTFTNAMFNLGATTGTVTVTYAAGTDGGTITNCAHLTGSTVNLEACNTQNIAAPFAWQAGDVISYTQATWDEIQGPAGALLLVGYNVVYLTTFGVMEIGIPGAAGFSIRFTDPVAVLDYFPASGANAALTNDVINPTATTAGAFGGHVVTLQLNVDFADAGLLVGTTGVPFGDVTLCNFPAQPLLNGTSVRSFLEQVRSLLGGGSASYPIATLAPITIELNAAFNSGGISSFATDHLVLGACP